MIKLVITLTNNLLRIFVEYLEYGAYDKRFFKKGTRKAFNCSKNLLSEIPTEKLANCEFSGESSPISTIEKICEDLENVLNWTFEDCSKPGRRNQRARNSVKRMKNLCKRVVKNM